MDKKEKGKDRRKKTSKGIILRQGNVVESKSCSKKVTFREIGEMSETPGALERLL